jgi:N-acetylglucosamine kinase-like BadF-type ATPase
LLQARDVVVGIATSGRTPYVLGAVDYAKRIGAFTIGFSCTNDSDLSKRVDLALTIPVGPEVLSGSTRLKAGTATKLVLNMMTTGAMILLGKTYGNLMVDLRATNEKLKARTNRIVRHLTGLAVVDADALLQRCNGELKTALVTKLAGTTPEAACERLQRADGRVGAVLDLLRADQANNADLCIGIDGGGSKTVALLAKRNVRAWTTIGRGEGGPSNIQTVGARAFMALDDAVHAAFTAAGLPRQCVASAVLGLAGAGRPGDRARIQEWATKVGLAAKVEVLTDADLLLAAASADGSGLAVISGTGSIAIAKRPDGVATRAGGWGPLLGDEGSGYQVALAGLQGVTRGADGRGKPTILTERFLAELKVATPQEMVPKVYGLMDRAELASLAHVVVKAADAQDAVAARIVQDAVEALALTAKAALRLADWTDAAVPIALAGGMFIALPTYGVRFLAALAKIGVTPAPFTIVTEPAEGALRLAQRFTKT